jgi:single-stranded DNA-binding protein
LFLVWEEVKMKGFRTGIVSTVKGYSGNEAEMSYTPNGKAVTKFRLAVGSGEKSPATWFTCHVWEEHDAKLAQEVVCKKGLAVVATGRQVNREYQGKHYTDLHVTELHVEQDGVLKKVELTDVKAPEGSGE